MVGGRIPGPLRAGPNSFASPTEQRSSLPNARNVEYQARKIEQRYKDIKEKAEGYVQTIKNLLDEDMRAGELFNLGLSGLMKLGEKALGESLSSHPYFEYHKQHLEALVSALNASSTHNNAMRQLDTALQSASAAETLARTLDAYTNRKRAAKLRYLYLDGRLRLLRESAANPNSPEVLKHLEETGLTGISIGNVMAEEVAAWRAEIGRLFFDAVGLLAMVEVEYRAAAAAMKSFNEKMQRLQQSDKNIDKVAGKALEQKQMWEAYDRDPMLGGKESSKGKLTSEAVMDPTLHARRQRDRVEEEVKTLGKMLDVVMSTDAFNPDVIIGKIGDL